MNIFAFPVSKFARGKWSWAASVGQVSHEFFCRRRETGLRGPYPFFDFLVRCPPARGVWTYLFSLLLSHSSIQQRLAGLSLFLCLLGVQTPNTECVFAQETPKHTAAGLKVAEGFEATLWAAEPDLVNPTFGPQPFTDGWFVWVL